MKISLEPLAFFLFFIFLGGDLAQAFSIKELGIRSV